MIGARLVRTHPKKARVTGVIGLVGLTTTLLTGCGSQGGGTDTSAPAPAAEQPAARSDNPAIGISPGGVTTRVDEPAQSTEEQYAQACMVAKEWMDARGGDPAALVEPYLKQVQASTDAGRAAFQQTWPELTRAQQSAVIIAVQAAADGGC